MMIPMRGAPRRQSGSCERRAWRPNRIRSSLSDALSSAQSLLPTLQEAKRVVEEKREPAVEAEKRWRAELEAEGVIRARVDQALARLEESCLRVLSLPSPSQSPSQSPSLPADSGHLDGAELQHQQDMVLHHMNWRLDKFLARHEHAVLWKAFRGTVAMHAFNALARGHLGTQVAACCIDEVPWLVCCVCVATDPLVDFQNAPKGLLLHWSVTDDESSGWHNSIPRGWSTHPGVCEPHGSTAWQTTMAHFNPTVGGETMTQIPVHSVVIQIPMDGIFLEQRGGIKFILKRNDTSDDVWIKSACHGDFYVSLASAIDYLNPSLACEDASASDGSPDSHGDESVPNNAECADVAVGEEESSSKYVWARALAEELIIAREEELAKYEADIPYAPSYAWLHHVASWSEITDYAINAGSSLSQYAKELRCLLELTDDAEIGALKGDCANLESDIEAFRTAEIQQRALQLEKDRLWEERELAIKEAARVHGELTGRIEAARRTIVAATGRETEVCEGDLVDLCSSMVLGSEIKGSKHGAGFFRQLFAGSGSTIKHMLASECIDRVTGVAGSIVTQVYYEGEAAAVEALMDAEEDVVDVVDSGDDVGNVGDDGAPRGQEELFPFDTVLIAVAWGEDFPSKISHSDLRLHWGFVSGKNGGWMPPTPGTVAVIHRETATDNPDFPDATAQDGGAATPSASDSLRFEAFHMRHRNGRPVLVDPLVRGIVLRVPVSELKAARIAGIEFVVVSGQEGKAGQHEVWMKKEGGSNFFAQIPLIRE